ncbi:hypothetical protein M569_08987, partial [Genlisea aurea]
MEWPTYLDEYEKLLVRMSKPRVIIDNAGCPDATRVMIDSARKHAILLESIQVLIDRNLSIKKAYISSDGRWFMDVFHVTDSNRNKLTDENILKSIEQSLEMAHSGRSKKVDGLVALELTGSDRVGLLSEVFAVLSNLNCDTMDAKVWTHNGRIASLVFFKDDEYGSPVEDSKGLDLLEAMLRNVLKGQQDDAKSAKTRMSSQVTHAERRLHQMMFEDRDYERRKPGFFDESLCEPVVVSVHYCLQRDYSVVNVQCKDRSKLLFDVVCTLTDMEYVVFHATVDASGDTAFLEFFIKHTDGTPISSEAENQRVIVCLRAAIERRAPRGIRLDLRTSDRKGLMAQVTRTFRENGLNVTMAEISTKAGRAEGTFYVTDADGNLPDPGIVQSVREKIGLSELIQVSEPPAICDQPSTANAMLVSLCSLVRRNLFNLG